MAIKKCKNGKTILPPIEHLDGEIPIEVDSNGKLKIDAKAGKWATDHVLHNIYMMDQNWMAHFDIPGKRWVMKRRSFSMGANPGLISLPNGMPLPTEGPEETTPPPIPKLPQFPEYKAMIAQEEIDCAKIWNQVRNEAHEFIMEYCDEIGARIRAVTPAIPGRFPSDTVKDHEHHLGYEISDKDSDRHGVSIGVRLRQKQFAPFLTVWSDNTMMTDYDHCELSDTVKEHLRDAIEKAVTG